ncbi:MAG: NAD(P)/FAD-dependent oxidoreductase [Thermoplasmatota archaeon]
MTRHNTVAVIGAGPAGLLAAHELSEHGISDVVVIDKGKDIHQRRCPMTQYTKCFRCQPCSILCGLGGAGGLSDGKLNLRADIGGNLAEFTDQPEELVEAIDRIFLTHGAPQKMYGTQVQELQKRASQQGIEFVPIPQRHIGSDRLPAVISSLHQDLEKKGVTFVLETEVQEIGKNDRFTLHTDRGDLTADYVVASAGRSGADWLSRQAAQLGIPARHAPIDIGVRVEVPAMVMEDIVQKAWDPKFRIYTPTYDDFVRTFCVCPEGFVVMEDYGDYVSVNGHSAIGRKSANTNFAFLVNVTLTEPQENTTAYGMSIASMATVLGGTMPIVQRLGDLRTGRRSTRERIQKSYVKPSLTTATPGDITMALPHRMVTDIVEGLDHLSRVIPGVAQDSTLLYAPEIKFYSMRFEVTQAMETPLPGFFVAGDGAGVSRGIVASAATGMIAARGILAKEGQKIKD